MLFVVAAIALALLVYAIAVTFWQLEAPPSRFPIPPLPHHPHMREGRAYLAIGLDHDAAMRATSPPGDHHDAYDTTLRRVLADWRKGVDGASVRIVGSGFPIEDGVNVNDVELDDTDDPVIIHGRVGALQGHYLLEVDDARAASLLNFLREHEAVTLVDRQVASQRLAKRLPLPPPRDVALNSTDGSAPRLLNGTVPVPAYIPTGRKFESKNDYDALLKRLNISDPGIGKQWHLFNPSNPGSDVNVSGVWDMGVNGSGVIAVVIDDGVNYEHLDIRDNFYFNSSYDFNLKQPLPLPRSADDYHGTPCAGEIAALPNDQCGVGVAYGAKVAGIRILGGEITDVDEALGIGYGFQENEIYSCSWGPNDNGQLAEGPPPLTYRAMLNGIKNGRGGLGSIYVFASGNGALYDDDCNYDGYANSIFGISIGAIDASNRQFPYSERCTALLGVTYTDLYSTSMVTGFCKSHFSGTSAAAPLAVGILTLALSVNKNMTWRDMQHVTIRGSRPVSIEDKSWSRTAAGRLYSDKFGYGRIDSYHCVMAAMSWTPVRPMVTLRSATVMVNQPIPNDPVSGISSSVTVYTRQVHNAYLSRLEHVTVTLHLDHERRGDLDITLRSPLGIESHIGPARRYDESTHGFRNWTFSSVKHWEEPVNGTWTLLIVDVRNSAKSGRLLSWSIKFWGEASEAFMTSGLPLEPPKDLLKTEVHEYVMVAGVDEINDDRDPPRPGPGDGGASPVLMVFLLTSLVGLAAYGAVLAVRANRKNGEGSGARSGTSSSWTSNLRRFLPARWNGSSATRSWQMLNQGDLEEAFGMVDFDDVDERRSPSPGGGRTHAGARAMDTISMSDGDMGYSPEARSKASVADQQTFTNSTVPGNQPKVTREVDTSLFSLDDENSE